MRIDDAKLKEMLLRENYVAEDDFKKAEKEAQREKVSLAVYLLDSGLITKDLLGQAIAESFQVPYADLNSNEPSAEQVRKIPEDIAKKFRAVLFSEDKEKVIVATDTPNAKELSGALSGIFPQSNITIAYGLPEDIDAAFIHYRKPLATRFTKILETQKRVAPEILDEIFRDALSYSASDIHFEPQQDETVIRFRVDGVLQEAGRVSKEHYENILNRI